MQGRNSSEASSDADEQMLLAVALACCARHGTSRASVLALRGGRGADPNRPHPHQGTLTKYERKPPSEYGLSVAGVDATRLRSGKPLLQLISLPNGFKRTASIQDVHAPADVVWSKILDLPNYDKYVDGVVSCEVYRREASGGVELVFAKYKIRAAAFTLEYFMQHEFERKANAMTFQLDYTRKSELADTVGYWYVEELDDGWCRVFYSTDSQIPAWIPGFMKDALVNLAAKRSTAWVDAECRKEMGLQLEGSGGGDVGGGDRSASAPPADTPSPTQRSLLLAALVGAYANHFLARTMALKQARRMVSGLIAKVAA